MCAGARNEGNWVAILHGDSVYAENDRSERYDVM